MRGNILGSRKKIFFLGNGYVFVSGGISSCDDLSARDFELLCGLCVICWNEWSFNLNRMLCGRLFLVRYVL
jgi:hypothetical protein